MRAARTIMLGVAIAAWPIVAKLALCVGLASLLVHCESAFAEASDGSPDGVG